jgi:CobQ-like glutamine amidotransferase family enzyme
MRIEVLFPEICNLFGDLANIRYLKLCLPDAEIIETSLKSRPKFLDTPMDLVYMGSTTERGLELVVEALSPVKDELVQRIDEGQLFLVTGNTMDVFGKTMESDHGLSLTGLGLFDTDAKYYMLKRHNSMFLGKFEDIEIVGFKSLFGMTHGAPQGEGLFLTVRGVGRNENEKEEGFRRNYFFATYLIGPLLVMNPPFTRYLLRRMGAPETLAFSETIEEAYRRRLAEFHSDSFDPIYH